MAVCGCSLDMIKKQPHDLPRKSLRSNLINLSEMQKPLSLNAKLPLRQHWRKLIKGPMQLIFLQYCPECAWNLSLMCLKDVWKVYERWRFSEGVWKVSGWCLECVWKTIGRCLTGWKLSWRCLEGVWKVLKVFERCLKSAGLSVQIFYRVRGHMGGDLICDKIWRYLK